MSSPGIRTSASPVAQGVRWDLGDLYDGPEDPRLREHLATAGDLAEALARRYRGRIAAGQVEGEELARALTLYEEVLAIGTRPSFYASLLFAADTQDPQAQALDQWARETWVEIEDRILFFDLELQRLPEPVFARAMADERLAPWRHTLELAARHRPHTLSEPEERILNRKELTSRDAFVQLYDELSGTLRFEIELDGRMRTLTDAEITALLHRPEPEVRARALTIFLETWSQHELVLTSIFNNLLLDHRVESDLRRFPTLIAGRHLENDIEPTVVEAMMDAVDRHYGDVQRFFRLKARLLGLPDFSVSDLYAPLGAASGTLDYAEGRKLVLDAFGSFSDRFAELAQRFFDEGWIDAEVRPAKRSGAFCAAHTPDHHPYVLASYTGTARDVSTLAHELGHGMHALLSSGNRMLVFDAPLVLAETASVFAEMLLTDHLLRRAPSAAARASLLCETLDEIYGTIFRQNAMTRFELAAHQARRSRRLDAEDLGNLWLESQQALFGDAVRIPEPYRWGWIYIPHFVHSPFYCYAYSFGDLLVLALFERYRTEGASFVPGYLELLSAGGSDRPERLLAKMGIDLGDPTFWDGGFGAVRRLLAELEEAVAQSAR